MTSCRRVVHPVEQVVPLRPVDVAERQAEPAHHVGVEALGVQHLRDVVDATARPAAETTASSSTSHISEILRLTLSGIGRSERHTIASGWMPMQRSAATECWVGLVFSSPDGPMYGTSETCRKKQLLAADLVPDLAGGLEERQRLDVADRAADLGDHDVDGSPPAPGPAIARMRALISLVMCGMTCTVSPRYSPRRSLAITAE